MAHCFGLTDGLLANKLHSDARLGDEHAQAGATNEHIAIKQCTIARTPQIHAAVQPLCCCHDFERAAPKH